MVKKVEVMEDKQRPQTRPIKPIENKRARRVTYVKRKDCIKKKTMELATLCDINACMLCFGPNGEVDTWPENPSEVKAAIDMYKEEYGKDDGGGKKVRRSSGCGSDEKIKKVEEANEIGDGAVAKRSEKLRKGLLGWDDGWLNGLSAESLTELSRQLQSKLEVLATRIEFLRMMMMINNDQNNAATYWFNNTESIHSFGADNVSISTPYQTLQTIELPASELSYEHEYHHHRHHHHPTSSAVPIWALNCYGEDAMNCNGGGNDRVAFIKVFDEILEETNVDFVNNNYITFDDSVSPATPNWTGDCCYGYLGWAYDEIMEETNLDSMINSYTQQLLAGSGMCSSPPPQLLPFDEVLLPASML